MFLLYLLDAVSDAASQIDTIGRVARFALDIGWEGESLWTFVDLAVRRFKVVASADRLQTYPWDILLVSGSPDQHSHDSRETSPCWKTWLERAQTHWVHTQQSTNNPPQLT
jgi:hypothetical protein